ncbi:polyprenyl synthetase family protein [Streptomyces sp. NPDC097619]|uniref:polyprenyl synthetase family protein n=1 Tax=Streptomyces sp. NPDC097619 TaxID=3157228 RepID=UPI003325A10C
MSDPGPHTVDPAAVDADVPGAVDRALTLWLAARLDTAGTLDPLFARELAEPVARFTREGGKRRRSRLLWWALRACGGSDAATAAAALRIGAALELLQTCALIHDDVMDGATLRRGRPAFHAEASRRHRHRAPRPAADRFGEAAAILAGDLALAWADDLVAGTVLDPWRAAAVRGLWSELRTEMVAGQLLDLHGQLTGTVSPVEALRAARLKSALYSVGRPLLLGAALAGADAGTTDALRSAGHCLGLAFQLRDDLDDLFADPLDTGKTCGGDIREGKPTYLAAVALARARSADDRAALKTLEHALGRADLSSADLDEVREAMVRTGARHAVETKIERLSARALGRLDGTLPDPIGEARLRDLLATAVASPNGHRQPPGPPPPSPAPSAPPADVREEADR